MNFLEAVAYVAREPHSHSFLSRPTCACPVLAAVGSYLNVNWSAAEIQLLIPLIPHLVGSHSTLQVARRRRYILIDAAIREIAPIGLEAVKWTDLADCLRGLAPIIDVDTSVAAHQISCKVRDEALKRKAYPGADAYAGWQATAVYQAVADFSATFTSDNSLPASDNSRPARSASAAARDAYVAIRHAAGIADAASGIDGGDATAPQEERSQRLHETRRPVVEVTLHAYERALAFRG